MSAFRASNNARVRGQVTITTMEDGSVRHTVLTDAETVALREYFKQESSDG